MVPGLPVSVEQQEEQLELSIVPLLPRTIAGLFCLFLCPLPKCYASASRRPQKGMAILAGFPLFPKSANIHDWLAQDENKINNCQISQNDS